VLNFIFRAGKNEFLQQQKNTETTLDNNSHVHTTFRLGPKVGERKWFQKSSIRVQGTIKLGYRNRVPFLIKLNVNPGEIIMINLTSFLLLL
jgi:hypothetical protein